MQVHGKDGIEFLDFKLKLENTKIAVNVFTKPLVFTLEKFLIIYHVIQHYV